ncbi:hypothetical protein SLA2020_265570 [Shorea laevis]
MCTLDLIDYRLPLAFLWDSSQLGDFVPSQQSTCSSRGFAFSKIRLTISKTCDFCLTLYALEIVFHP